MSVLLMILLIILIYVVMLNIVHAACEFCGVLTCKYADKREKEGTISSDLSTWTNKFRNRKPVKLLECFKWFPDKNHIKAWAIWMTVGVVFWIFFGHGLAGLIWLCLINHYFSYRGYIFETAPE